MIVTPEGDYFEFNIKFDEHDVLSTTSVYGLMYFLFDVYNIDNDYNPFKDWKKYLEVATIRTKFM